MSPSEGDNTPQFTKILATLGPASDEPGVVEKLVNAGATMFRLNFSHGRFDEQKMRLDEIRAVEARTGTPLTVVADLPGPKIRVGQVPEEGIRVDAGMDLAIDPSLEMSVGGESPVLSATYSGIAGEVEPGHRVLINDGAVRMLAVESDGKVLRCRVVNGGLITSKKGINLPDSDLSVPSVTDYDWTVVDWAVEHGVDYLALSFVRKAEDIRIVHAHMREMSSFEKIGTGLFEAGGQAMIPIIAKIETPQGVANIDAIAEEAEAIMVARGDLGVEMDVAEVPMTQKRLIKAAHVHGKPCIVATQMLESMIQNRFPTRAEVSDVANAILDRTDAVMLSGETAVGKYPVVAVDTMRRVAVATERSMRAGASQSTPPARLREQKQIIPALAHAAWHMCRDTGANVIVVWAEHGGTARFLSRNNFDVPIVAYSSDIRSVRRMNLLYAVTPVHCPEVPQHRSEFAEVVDRFVMERGLVERGDVMILLGGKPLDKPGSTNTIAIRYAGELAGASDPDFDETMIIA